MGNRFICSDAEMLISISEVFDTPVNEIIGENILEKETNDLKVISEKLEIINELLAMEQKRKRKKTISLLIFIDVGIVLLFVILAMLGSPYLTWDYNNPEWAVIGTIWHSFEWIFFKVAPIIVIVITLVLVIMLLKRKR